MHQQHHLEVRRVDQTDLQVEGLPQQRAQGRVVLGVEAAVVSICRGKRTRPGMPLPAGTREAGFLIAVSEHHHQKHSHRVRQNVLEKKDLSLGCTLNSICLNQQY